MDESSKECGCDKIRKKRGEWEMGMPVEFNTMIVTKGKEKRVSEDNLFVLEKEGYRLYPLDIPLEVRKTIQGEKTGTAIVEKLELEQKRTRVTYKLVSLHSTN
jgi:hypothetical protein